MTKKYGGIITEWSLNTLSFSVDQVRALGVEIKTDKVFILSGFIKEDPTGRFEIGDHFRSSVVIDVDAEKGIVETQKTIYHLHGESGGYGDMGDMITRIFY